MYIQRDLEKPLLVLAKQYPVLTITGPRQSGKTTLCRKIFKKKLYISLEDPNNRDFAEKDPKTFLAQDKNGMIIDEIQRAPELMSYIQTIVDNKPQKGYYILTGSQQFELMAKLTQSLAGRTAIIKLLPFSYSEIYKKKYPDLEDVLYKGFYPKIFSERLDPTKELSFYINTYIERDVRLLTNVKDLKTFETFIKICAGRTGQVLNYANISNEVGVDIKTVKKWLSILEASFIIRIIPPYYKNMNKRLVKSPKLYFIDTGLVCYLLGIKKPAQLTGHPLLGSIFETYVYGELFKNFYNKVENDNLYFYRDHRGNEVDVIFDKATSIEQLEIKLSKTVTSAMFNGLCFLKDKDNYTVDRSLLVYGGNRSFKRNDIDIISWRNISI
ncbi:MAG: ATP-binding protein [Candidatus Margulisbacteria bacterium]|nr:ATP-binding protein [Candidatus Margulisiibacteriota bacterium]